MFTLFRLVWFFHGNTKRFHFGKHSTVSFSWIYDCILVQLLMLQPSSSSSPSPLLQYAFLHSHTRFLTRAFIHHRYFVHFFISFILYFIRYTRVIHSYVIYEHDFKERFCTLPLSFSVALYFDLSLIFFSIPILFFFFYFSHFRSFSSFLRYVFDVIFITSKYIVVTIKENERK